MSGLVGFLLFVNPALSVQWPASRPPTGFVRRPDLTTDSANAAIGPPSSRPGWSTRRRAVGLPSIETLAWSGSADLRAAAGADGFAVFAAGDRDYPPGEIVDFLPMS